MCGLINRRCREVLRIGVEKRVERQHSFPESSERRSRHWCDFDDRAGVIVYDIPPRLITAHRPHEERVGEPLMHKLHLALDEDVASPAKHDAWSVKVRRQRNKKAPPRDRVQFGTCAERQRV